MVIMTRKEGSGRTPDQRFGPNTELITTRLERISRFPWFRPPQEPNPEQFIKLDYYFQRLLGYPKRFPLKIVDDLQLADKLLNMPSFDNLRQEASRLAYNTASDNSRMAARTSLEGEVKRAIAVPVLTACRGKRMVAEHVVNNIQDYFAWLVVGDLITDRVNPFKPLVDAHQNGCGFLGLVNSPYGNKIESLILIPPSNPIRRALNNF